MKLASAGFFLFFKSLSKPAYFLFLNLSML